MSSASRRTTPHTHRQSLSLALPATVAVEPLGWTIDYTAAPGQINKAVLNEALYGHGKVTFVIDDVVPISIKSGTPCTYPVSRDHTKVSCTVPGQQTEIPYSVVKLDLGDGNDTATNTGSFDGNEIEGGPNADTIRAGREAVVDGQGGNDFVYGGAGPQTLLGGPDAGKDTILGGPGNDTIRGGQGDDILYGNSGGDWIFGVDGNDKLYGGPGADMLDGGPGRNVVHQD